MAAYRLHRDSRRAFLISPIAGFSEDGQRDLRRNFADNVRENIIDPAIRKLSEPVLVERGDEINSKRDIMKLITEEIAEADIIICLISEYDFRYNPNVYYELALAHSAGRPVIILKHVADNLPFDLNSYRCIQFYEGHVNGSLDPFTDGGQPAQNLHDEIARLLESAEKGGLYEPFLLVDEGKPQKARSVATRIGAVDRFIAYEDEELSSHLLMAEKEIWIAGASLERFTSTQRNFFRMPDTNMELTREAAIEDLLAVQLAIGVDVHVLMYHPDHPTLSVLRSDEPRWAQVRSSAEKAYPEWLKIKELSLREAERQVAEDQSGKLRLGSMTVTQVRKRDIRARVMATEKRAIISPFWHTYKLNSGPCVDVRAGTLWHDNIVNDLRYLEELNQGDLGDDPTPVPALVGPTADRGLEAALVKLTQRVAHLEDARVSDVEKIVDRLDRRFDHLAQILSVRPDGYKGRYNPKRR